MNYLKKELDLQDIVLDVKLIKEALHKLKVKILSQPYSINPNCVHREFK